MPLKMKFPDGTEVEGEVKDIMQLILELREAMGFELPKPDELDKHR